MFLGDFCPGIPLSRKPTKNPGEMAGKERWLNEERKEKDLTPLISGAKTSEYTSVALSPRNAENGEKEEEKQRSVARRDACLKELREGLQVNQHLRDPEKHPNAALFPIRLFLLLPWVRKKFGVKRSLSWWENNPYQNCRTASCGVGSNFGSGVQHVIQHLKIGVEAIPLVSHGPNPAIFHNHEVRFQAALYPVTST